jgi:hypothetical protein
MAASTLATAAAYGEPARDAPVSAVSWAAIFAGAVAAAALSMILLVLGTGLGLTSLSPFANAGASAVTIGISAVVWVMVTQALASGLGGYIAGRLRSRWVSVHSDEVYFRDTAHGFLSWAVATLLTAVLLASAIGSVVGGAAKAGASVAAGAAKTVASAAGVAGDAVANSNDNDGPLSYFVDSMFRRTADAADKATSPEASPSGRAPTTEVTRILLRADLDKPLPAEDQRYLGQLIAQHTGISQQEAEKRVQDTVNTMQTKAREAEAAAREAAEKARKAGVTATLWLFASLLLGAFSASLAATWGGRQRDT